MFDVNVTIFIVLFVALMSDWIWQTDEEATCKYKKPYIRFRHSAKYALFSSIFLSIFVTVSMYNLFTIFLILLISHHIIDKRRIVVFIMEHIKKINRKKIDEMIWMNIAIDQWLHVFVIFIISVIF